MNICSLRLMAQAPFLRIRSFQSPNLELQNRRLRSRDVRASTYLSSSTWVGTRMYTCGLIEVQNHLISERQIPPSRTSKNQRLTNKPQRGISEHWHRNIFGTVPDQTNAPVICELCHDEHSSADCIGFADWDSSAVRVPKRDDLKIHRKPLSSATKGQFEGESVRDDEPLCNRDIGPENIVRSETVRDFDVVSRRRW